MTNPSDCTNSQRLPHAAPGGVRFTFESAASTVSVAVAGTFNSWVGTAAPLQRTGPTSWQALVPAAPGRHHYKYVVDGRDWIVDPANPWISEDAQNNSCFTLLESGEVYVRDGSAGPAAPGPLYRAHAALKSPAWLDDAVIYQLSVRAFGGSFAGMHARLDYLQELGVNTVWMMPFHPIGIERRIGPLGDPYAVRDFLAIDPELGSADELRALIGAMHARGMRVLQDWTLNRASCDNSLTRTHPDWFARDADGKPCYLVPQRAHFAGFDFSNREARAWLIAAMRDWVGGFGFDGMRFDDADITPTDFLDEIRSALAALRPDIVLISQSCDELHHVAACDLTYEGGVRDVLKRIATGAADAGALARYWEESRYTFPRGALRMRWLEEKEQGRAHAYFGPDLHLAAAAVLLTLDGVPHLLMGQESNEPRWNNWESLFTPFELDWGAFDQPTFAHYQTLIALRAHHAVLRQGELRFIDGGSPGVLAYARGSGAAQLLVAVNLRAETAPIPPGLGGARPLYARDAGARHLPPYGWLIASAQQVRAL